MLSRLYGAVTNFRNTLYEKGVFKSVPLGVPVISVGNITFGGTGKTPMVALIAEMLIEKGEKVGILTRGYGRENPKRRVLVSDGERILAESKQAGDEPFELAVKLLGKAVIVADADRASAGIWAREKFGITAFVLDDAFQHRRVKRDTDIVLIDATDPFGNNKSSHFGLLREPAENLKRADLIVITRANLAENIDELKSRISKYNSQSPILIAENRISNLVELRQFQNPKPETRNPKPEIRNSCFAFCALGNPNSFFEQLRRENFDLISTQTFPDHYSYQPKDIAELEKKARRDGAEILLTTAKDAVKLKDLNFRMPCLVVEIEMLFDKEFDFQHLKFGVY